MLGFTETGRRILSGLRKERSAAAHTEQEKQDVPVPVITNINKEKSLITGGMESLLRLDVHASDIYNLIANRSVYDFSDHRQPVRMT